MQTPRTQKLSVFCNDLLSPPWQWPILKPPFQEHQGIHLWKICLSEINEHRFISYLSSEELDRVQRFHFHIDRKRSILSRAITRQLCSRYLSLPSRQIRFERFPEGKPYLKDHHERLQFNISHSGDLLLIALHFGKSPIGIDVEEIDLRFEYFDLANQFFTETEKESLDCHTADEQFYRIWTRKEALMKATGQGLSDEFFCIDMSRNTDQITLPNDQMYFISTFSPAEDYLASIAIQHQEKDIRFIDYGHYLKR